MSLCGVLAHIGHNEPTMSDPIATIAELLEPVFAGDTITSETRLKSLEEKSGGSGPFVLQMTETTYTNQDGAVVARAVGRSIAR